MYIHAYRMNRNIDSDFNLAIWRTCQDCQINLRHYQSIYVTAWVSLHIVLKSTNLSSRQQRFLSKLPNIMVANNSAYTVHTYVHTSICTLGG